MSALTNAIAEAFIRWPLPESVCSDPCSTKQGLGRIGTNLLSFVEAEQMAREVVLPIVSDSHLCWAESAGLEVALAKERHMVNWLLSGVGRHWMRWQAEQGKQPTREDVAEAMEVGP